MECLGRVGRTWIWAVLGAVACGSSGAAGPGEGGRSAATGGRDAGSAGAEATTTGGAGGGEMSGGGAASSSSAGGSSSAEGGAGPQPDCEGYFVGDCGQCLEAHCCAEVAACGASPSCWSCVTGASSDCAGEDDFEGLIGCATASCDEPCFQAQPGVGTTVEECQGSGSIVGTIDGEQAIVHSGFGAQMEGALNVFLFGRTSVDALNFPGQPGEYKVRLLIGDPIGTAEYGGMMVVTKWSDTTQSWEDLSPVTDLVVVTITDFQVAEPEGLMCNGWLAGQAQAVFYGDAVAVDFAVPLLTPDFPSQ